MKRLSGIATFKRAVEKNRVEIARSAAVMVWQKALAAYQKTKTPQARSDALSAGEALATVGGITLRQVLESLR